MVLYIIFVYAHALLIGLFRMASPQFALVRFHDDKKCFIRPIEDIRVPHDRENKRVLVPFSRKDKNDFIKTNWYYVKWFCPEGCQEDHDRHYNYYKAMILHLAGIN